jgi:pimeloyl-ACP methyl ester carboxylesterase
MTPPRAAGGMIDAIAGATVVRIPGCGHNVQTEAPDELRDALAGWLRRLPVASVGQAA